MKLAGLAVRLDETAGKNGGSLMIDIVVPATDHCVQMHHESAKMEIEHMSPSRKFGAETNLRSWRKVLTGASLSGTDGYAFLGHALAPGAPASLENGSLIVAVDISWARARWYARNYIAPVEQKAALLRVTDYGELDELIVSTKKSWARDLLGYLATNRALCEAADVRIK